MWSRRWGGCGWWRARGSWWRCCGRWSGWGGCGWGRWSVGVARGWRGRSGSWRSILGGGGGGVICRWWGGGVVAGEGKLVAVLWEVERVGRVRLGEMERGSCEVLERAERQLAEYFAGGRREFDLPLGVEGTEFQKRVWEGLRKIPFGETG